MVTTTAKIAGIPVAKIGHGLMMMTWTVTPVEDEQAFEAIKAGIDALPPDTKMLINSGEFYGVKPPTANLELIARFFDKYPTYADKVFLSVKGGAKPDSLEPDGSPENLKRSVNKINEVLRGTKRLDLFECARVAHNATVEEMIGTLSALVKEGKFDYIGMSECSAESLKRGHAVHPISVVEIEISPWSYEEETKKVIATAKELGVAVAAYSPLGRGFLVGKFKSGKDFAEGDWRRNLTRFRDGNLEHNLAIVDTVKALAEKKGITAAQLCLSWVSHLGPHIIPIPGSSRKDRTLENLAAADIVISDEELAEITATLEKVDVKGDRYWGAPTKDMHLWG